MPIKTPSRVQMTCSTTGNGPYTFTNPSPALVGKRTIAQAVADGSIVNGQAIIVAIVDPAAAGSAKMMEISLGTINTSTLVFTVTQVIEKSAALTSGGGWGAGTRDVLISPPVGSLVAFLNEANVFTATQAIDGTTPTHQLTSGGVTRFRSIYSANALFQQYFDAAGVIRASVEFNNTDARFTHFTAAGAIEGILTVGANLLQFGDGTTTFKVVRFVGGGVVKMTFNSAPPVGWTRINITGERVGKYATASDTPEAQGGSWFVTGLTTPLAVTDGHAITIAQLPSHEHAISVFSGGLGGFNQAKATVESSSAGTYDSAPVGGGQAHSHNIQAMTIASTGAWRPAYEIIVKASFD